jgi:hypothetical protein
MMAIRTTLPGCARWRQQSTMATMRMTVNVVTINYWCGGFVEYN